MHKLLNGHEQIQRTLQMLMRTRSYIRTKYTVKALNEKKQRKEKKNKFGRQKSTIHIKSDVIGSAQRNILRLIKPLLGSIWK